MLHQNNILNSERKYVNEAHVFECIIRHAYTHMLGLNICKMSSYSSWQSCLLFNEFNLLSLIIIQLNHYMTKSSLLLI